MKIRSLILSTAVAALLGTSGAFAAGIFNFSPGPGEATLGTSQVFWDDSATYKITAYGFVKAGDTPTALYQKYDGVGETGLGLAADAPDTEIPPAYYIQLDVSDLIAKGFTSMTLKFGSMQDGEQANIYGDTSGGSFLTGSSLVSALVGSPVIQWVTLNLDTPFFNITGGGVAGADPVLESVTVKVPDAGSTVVVLGAALLGLATLTSRRSRRNA